MRAVLEAAPAPAVTLRSGAGRRPRRSTRAWSSTGSSSAVTWPPPACALGRAGPAAAGSGYRPPRSARSRSAATAPVVPHRGPPHPRRRRPARAAPRVHGEEDVDVTLYLPRAPRPPAAGRWRSSATASAMIATSIPPDGGRHAGALRLRHRRHQRGGPRRRARGHAHRAPHRPGPGDAARGRARPGPGRATAGSARREGVGHARGHAARADRQPRRADARPSRTSCSSSARSAAASTWTATASVDLDRERIYYFGQSFGGIYGTLLMAVEPAASAWACSTWRAGPSSRSRASRRSSARPWSDQLQRPAAPR